MKVPMREKYVDEAAGIWIEFGTHEDGSVDVSDQNGRDVFNKLPPDKAKAVVDAQSRFRDELYEILCKPVARGMP